MSSHISDLIIDTLLYALFLEVYVYPIITHGPTVAMLSSRTPGISQIRVIFPFITPNSRHPSRPKERFQQHPLLSIWSCIV